MKPNTFHTPTTEIRGPNGELIFLQNSPLEIVRAVNANDESQEAYSLAENRIKELCEKVNFFSNKLGLGRKVRAEDWTDFRETVRRKFTLRAIRKAEGK